MNCGEKVCHEWEEMLAGQLHRTVIEYQMQVCTFTGLNNNNNGFWKFDSDEHHIYSYIYILLVFSFQKKFSEWIRLFEFEVRMAMRKIDFRF